MTFEKQKFTSQIPNQQNRHVPNQDYPDSMSFPPVDRLPLFSLEEIIDRTPIIVSPDTSLREVFARMKQSQEAGKEADCVLIAMEDQLLGIFTIREVVDFFAQGIYRMNVPISEVMNSQIPTLTLSETSLNLEELNYFCSLEIAYLPVISTEEKLLGLLTLKKLSAYWWCSRCVVGYPANPL